MIMQRQISVGVCVGMAPPQHVGSLTLWFLCLFITVVISLISRLSLLHTCVIISLTFEPAFTAGAKVNEST